MNRTIKFRVWWNGEMWYQGRIGSIWFVDEKIERIDLNNEPFDNSRNGDTWTRRDDFILEQFTGLYDCCGKEIYEGDRVYIFGSSNFKVPEYFEVIYKNGAFGYIVSHGVFISFAGNHNFTIKDGKWLDIQVIGHIHEGQK